MIFYFYYAYYLPTSSWHWNKVDFGGAAKAAIALRKQTLDPELRWKMQFEDINMYTQSRAPEGAIKALAKLRKRLKSGYYPNISDRLDLPNLGIAIGTNQLEIKGQGVVNKIKGFCKSRDDNTDFLIMLANMRRTSGKFAAAGSLYLKAGAGQLRPIDRWDYHQNAVGCYWKTSRDQYGAVQKKYTNKLSTAPYAAALLYYQWGAKFWADTSTSAPRRRAKGIWLLLSFC